MEKRHGNSFSPISEEKRREAFSAALEQTNRKYAKALKKLAE